MKLASFPKTFEEIQLLETYLTVLLSYFSPLRLDSVSTEMLLLLLLPTLAISVPFIPSLETRASFDLVAGFPRPGGETEPQRVCLTESCVKTAARLLRQMDRTADPCQDFYQFACGGFLADTLLPEHKTRLGSYDLLSDELNKNLKALFEAEPVDAEPRVYQGREELSDGIDI